MKTLSKLNQRASKVFGKLMEGLTKLGDHKKVDNAPGAFMAVCIEIVEETKAGKVVSIAHYHEVNGDLCRDPDCTFLISDGAFTIEPGIFPLSFRQDNLGIDRHVASVLADGHVMCWPEQQRDLTVFANQWFINISGQQF